MRNMTVVLLLTALFLSACNFTSPGVAKATPERIVETVVVTATPMRVSAGTDQTPMASPAPAGDKTTQVMVQTASSNLPSWANEPTPVPNWSAVNCPPPIYPFGASAVLTVDMKFPDASYHLNVSRSLPAQIAAAGPRNESNALITLGPGVSRAEITYNGSGYAYPYEMVNSVQGCSLQAETLGRGGNWPSELTGIPSGVFNYHYPYGVVEQPGGEQRWPDVIYALRWWDNNGVENRWVNSEFANDPSVITAIEWLTQPDGVALTTTTPVVRLDPNCARNDVIANGNNQTATACGWMKLSFWYSGYDEHMILLYSYQPVMFQDFNGSLSSWDHMPSRGDVGNLPIGTVAEAQNGGVSINGDYSVFEVR